MIAALTMRSKKALALAMSGACRVRELAEHGWRKMDIARIELELAKLNAETVKIHRGRYWLPAVYIAGLFAAAFALAKLFVN